MISTFNKLFCAKVIARFATTVEQPSLLTELVIIIVLVASSEFSDKILFFNLSYSSESLPTVWDFEEVVILRLILDILSVLFSHRGPQDFLGTSLVKCNHFTHINVSIPGIVNYVSSNDNEPSAAKFKVFLE
jgi:hypothetical protein